MLWFTARKLRSRKASVRRAAAEQLGASRDLRALKLLAGAVQDDDPGVRRAAQDALANVRSAAHKDLQDLCRSKMDGLLRALKQGHHETRATAARALGRVEKLPAFRALRSALHHEDEHLRRSAATILGDLRRRALKALEAKLRDGEIYTMATSEAVESVERIGGPAALQCLLAALEHTGGSDSVKAALVRAGGAAVGELVGYLEHQYYHEVRVAAAEVLGELKSPAAVEALIAATFRDDNPFVRIAVAHALGKIGDPRCVAALARAVLVGGWAGYLEGDLQARSAAAGALGWIGNAEAAQALCEKLREVGDRIGVLDSTVCALEELLERRCKDLPVDLLRRLGNLQAKQVTTVVHEWDPTSELVTKLDCSKVRRLATSEVCARERVQSESGACARSSGSPKCTVVICPCGAKCRVKAENIGRRVRCPKCRRVFLLKQPEQ